MRATVVATSIAMVASQGAGTIKHDVKPRLSYWQCSETGCDKREQSVTIDANWRWTHNRDGYKNCYKGNSWDPSFCPDPETCTQNCVIEGEEEYENTYGVSTRDAAIDLKFVTSTPQGAKNVGSRVYLMDSTEERYEMFQLKNKEFTFDVDVSALPCGVNGALYFVGMDADGGMSRYPSNKAGAKFGTGYCDAQCPQDVKWINGAANSDFWVHVPGNSNAGFGRYGSCCTEVDIWEANKMSQAYTMHSCEMTGAKRCDAFTPECGNGAHRGDGFCDKSGCDYAPYRMNVTDFFGPGADFDVDTSKPFSVTTRFITHDNTDTGKVTEVRRLYRQNGRVFTTPSVTVGGKEYDSISDDFCKDWGVESGCSTFTAKGGLENINDAWDQGMVLVMSLWDDATANMLWLDSSYPVESKSRTDQRGTCSTDSGRPADVEREHPDAKVVWSNLRFGPIGMTTTSEAKSIVV